MIRTISPQDMREMERAFLEGTGYPSILLMEHAAQAALAGRDADDLVALDDLVRNTRDRALHSSLVHDDCLG